MFVLEEDQRSGRTLQDTSDVEIDHGHQRRVRVGLCLGGAAREPVKGADRVLDDGDEQCLLVLKVAV